MKIIEITQPIHLTSDNINEHAPLDIMFYIQQHCSEILKLYNSMSAVLYSGRQYNHDVRFFMEYNRKNRVPMCTTPEIQEKIDSKLQQAGFNALRHNSMFCTGNRSQAGTYGTKRFVIFPFNGFSYTWCMTSRDLYCDYINGTKYMYKLPGEYVLDTQQADKASTFKNDLDNLSSEEFVKKYKFMDTNLDGAINSNGEVLICAEKYIGIDANYYSVHGWKLYDEIK